MVEEITDLYKLPNIGKYEDTHLLALHNECVRLEEQVYAIAQDLSNQQRCVIEDYIATRNDLEIETFKTALRWGSKHIH